MSSANFLILRKSLFLSKETLSELLGVSSRTIKRWEYGEWEPPIDAIEQMEALYSQLICIAQEWEKKYFELAKNHTKPRLVALVVYDAKNYYQYNPDEFPSVELHHCLISMIFQRLKLMGVDCAPVLFDPEDYDAWLLENGYTDDRARRSEWATEKIV